MKSAKVNMLNGKITKNIVLFSIPVVCTGILQLLFNAADIIVVGNFAPPGSIAAVGATGSLINLLVNLFMGFSVGVCVVVARYFGEQNYKGIGRAVHTSIMLAVICGLIILAAGIALSRPMLSLMATPPDVIDRSCTYIRIYFLGAPAMLIYNFGSSIMRAAGETRKPLYYLIVAGVVNVILNLVFVICFNMGVAGVAAATSISQTISAALVVICLANSSDACRLSFKKLKIHKKEFLMIAKTGIPAGIQGSLFSISNLLIQSSVNSFGSVVVEGNSAAMSIDGFIYTTMNSISQAAITFTSQNFGAKNYKRIYKIIVRCFIVNCCAAALVSGLIYIFKTPLLGLYLNDAAAIEIGEKRLMYFCLTYFLCGTMEIMAGAMRGIGYSTLPMVVTLLGACGFRILWIYTAFVRFHSLDSLYISYPVSWALTTLAHIVCFVIMMRKLTKGKQSVNTLAK